MTESHLQTLPIQLLLVPSCQSAPPASSSPLLFLVKRYTSTQLPADICHPQSGLLRNQHSATTLRAPAPHERQPSCTVFADAKCKLARRITFPTAAIAASP